MSVCCVQRQSVLPGSGSKILEASEEGVKEPDTIEGMSLSFSSSKDKYLLFSNNKLFLNNTYLTLPQNK